MIDVSKVKVGDSFWVLQYTRIYEPDDEHYSFDLPLGINIAVVKKVRITPMHSWILSTQGDYYVDKELYYTKEEAGAYLHKKIKRDWNHYKCDSMIKKLLNVQKIVKDLK